MTSGTHNDGGPTRLDWEEAADIICRDIGGRFGAMAKTAADDFYQEVLETTQEYLRENTLFNLASELSAARAQAQHDRQALTKSVALCADLVRALEFIRDGYANQDVSHVDFRVKSYEVALDALESAQGDRS